MATSMVKQINEKQQTNKQTTNKQTNKQKINNKNNNTKKTGGSINNPGLEAILEWYGLGDECVHDPAQAGGSRAMQGSPGKIFKLGALRSVEV